MVWAQSYCGGQSHLVIVIGEEIGDAVEGWEAHGLLERPCHKPTFSANRQDWWDSPTITFAEHQPKVGGNRNGLSCMLRTNLEHKTYKQVLSMELKEQRKLRRKAWCHKMLMRLIHALECLWSSEAEAEAIEIESEWLRQQPAGGKIKARCCHLPAHARIQATWRTYAWHTAVLAVHFSGCHL